MSNYTSISRNSKGFNYQSDWDSIDEWKRKVDGADEIEWSILVFVPLGMTVLKYSEKEREFIQFPKF